MAEETEESERSSAAIGLVDLARLSEIARMDPRRYIAKDPGGAQALEPKSFA